MARLGWASAEAREHHRDALSKTQGKTSHMRTHLVGSHPGDLAEILSAFRMDIVKPASSALERQVREVVEISKAPEISLLNSREEYNRCLLPRMVLEGPKPLRVQEAEYRANPPEPLSLEEEERAILAAKKALKSKLDRYREQRGPPRKRHKTNKGEQLPGYQLPPTWDKPVMTNPRDIECRRNDIRTYFRPLRRFKP